MKCVQDLLLGSCTIKSLFFGYDYSGHIYNILKWLMHLPLTMKEHFFNDSPKLSMVGYLDAGRISGSLFIYPEIGHSNQTYALNQNSKSLQSKKVLLLHLDLLANFGPTGPNFGPTWPNLGPFCHWCRLK